MEIETLISTINKESLDFIEKMNIQTNCIIANQTGKEKVEIFLKNKNRVSHFQSSQIGLSKNRNLSLFNCNSDIAILADDDIEYLPDLQKKIINAYKDNPEADVIIFNLYEEVPNRFITKKKFKVNFFNFMRFGSVRITFRVKSIKKNNIYFDEMFGSGGPIPIGEDTIFLRDCLCKGLNIVAVPDFILKLNNERESTWFTGYNNNYFINKGKLYKRLSKYFFIFLCLQDSVRHSNEYASYGNFLKVFRVMLTGALEIKR